jgi:hypothetical protein
MRRDRRKPIDAFLVLAKASFGDRRRRSPAGIVVAVLVFVLLLAVPIVLLWPGPEQPPLLLAAFDRVALPHETVALCARVEPFGEENATGNLARCNLFFQAVQSDWRAEFATDRNGMVTVERSFSTVNTPVEIIVRYPGDGHRRPGTQATARVFTWPAETPLLMVDVEQTLPDADAATLWTANNLDIRPWPGVVAFLRAARAKYRIGYLSAGADRPSRYNKLRAWLERGWAPEQEQFPDGPVLARACCLPLREPAEFLQATLKDLKRRFQGTTVGITGSGENARYFCEAGWRTFLLSEEGTAPEGVTVVKSWNELHGRLP